MPTARPRRYPSDTSDTEWQLIAAYLPAGGGRERGGRPVTYPRRDIVDATRYLDHNSCVWRALPVDFPPWRTVYHYFRTWTRNGTLTRLHAGLREHVRLAEGRNAEPTAAIVDSQSVRAAETVVKTSRGYDAGKNVNGRKRHIVVDTTGLLLIIMVTGAGVQDRDAARALLWALGTCFTRVTKIWADGGYAGQLVTWAAAVLGLAVEIVRKLADQVGFKVLHRRWVVERSLSWINRCRRTVRDYECHPEHHAAMVQWAMVIIMTRRLARYHKTGRLQAVLNTS
ncbi:IS5 family transposase [Micromonospora sp. MH33]|uniref:IS5 family transposase n=1 Tax=Micromonospora sp. MH33 TaxID=1945509 RepID=UPI001AEFFDF5|nr:IS5 family transposase [Micromonospora sp. MH33]